MSGNPSDKACESVTERMNSVRELVAEELIAISGGDGPPGCIPGVNCAGDPKRPKELGEDGEGF